MMRAVEDEDDVLKEQRGERIRMGDQCKGIRKYRQGFHAT